MRMRRIKAQTIVAATSSVEPSRCRRSSGSNIGSENSRRPADRRCSHDVRRAAPSARCGMIDCPFAEPPSRPFVSLPELHLSKPGVVMPATACRQRRDHPPRARARSKVRTHEFAQIASAIEHVFGLCKTQVRYLEPDERPGIIADYAVAAAKQCLEVNDVVAGRGGPRHLRRHRAPVLRAGDRDGGRRQARPQANARVRRDRRLRRSPGGDPDRRRVPGPARQLPHRADLHVRAVGPVPQLRHPDRPRPADEDRRA